MKELAFTIAQRIATDKSTNTVIVCAAILKEAFMLDGIPSNQANVMAIDGVKVIMKAMMNVKP